MSRPGGGAVGLKSGIRPAFGCFDRSELLLNYVGHGVNDAYWFLLPALLPLILRQFSLQYVGGGGILTAFLGTVALGSFLLGRLSDRIPRRVLIGGGFLLSALGFLACSRTTTLTGFLILVLVTAVGVSAFHPVMVAWLDERFTSHRGRIFSAFEFWGATTLLLMLLLFGVLVKSLGWRGLTLLMSAPGLLLGVLFLRNRSAGVSSGVATAALPAAGGGKPAAERLRPATLPLYLGSTCLRLVGIYGVLNFLPTYLVEGLHLSASLAAYTSGFIFAGGMAGVRLAGRAIERWGPFPVLLVCTAGSAPLLLALSLPLTAGPLAVVLFLVGVLLSSTSPAQSLTLAGLGHSAQRGRNFGLLMGLSAVTQSLGPILFGLLAQRTGLGTTIRLFTLPVAAGLLLLLALGRRPEVRRPAS